MSDRSISIRSLLLMLVAVAIVPVAAVSLLSIYRDAERGSDEARANTRTLAKIIAANTSRTLTANREAMEALAQRPLMQAVDIRRCDPLLDDFHTLFPRFANLTTIDLQGIAVCSAVPQPGGKPVDVSKTEWFQRALAEKGFLAGDPFVGPITGRQVSVLVSPIRDDGGNLKGFVGLPLDLQQYDPNISSAPLPPGTRYGIVSIRGRLIWRNEDPEQLVGKSLLDNAVVRKAMEVRDGVFDGTGTDGVERFYAVAPIPEADWYAFVGIPSQAIRDEARRNTVLRLLLDALFLALLAGCAVYLAQRIAAPVQALAAVARRLKEGDGEVRAAVAGPTEVAEVAAEFNEMVDTLKAAHTDQQRLNADLEERVAARTAELERANKALEAFSYSVSHDLRAPLRAINGYAQLLREDEADHLSADGCGMLDRLSANTNRLGHLIDDILDYSRAGRLPLRRAAVDLDTLVNDIVDELRQEFPAVNFEIRLLPVVQGDAAMLRQIFVNLLGNACKFSARRERPLVEVWSDATDGATTLHVRDNGIGFDMQYADKLFGIFQRLTGQFPGSGVGLAIVKQLVERHGGRVWCEAAPDAGAAFHFTLGKAELAAPEATAPASSAA